MCVPTILLAPHPYRFSDQIPPGGMIAWAVECDVMCVLGRAPAVGTDSIFTNTDVVELAELGSTVRIQV